MANQLYDQAVLIIRDLDLDADITWKVGLTSDDVNGTYTFDPAAETTWDTTHTNADQPGSHSVDLATGWSATGNYPLLASDGGGVSVSTNLLETPAGIELRFAFDGAQPSIADATVTGSVDVDGIVVIANCTIASVPDDYLFGYTDITGVTINGSDLICNFTSGIFSRFKTSAGTPV